MIKDKHLDKALELFYVIKCLLCQFEVVGVCKNLL